MPRISIQIILLLLGTVALHAQAASDAPSALAGISSYQTTRRVQEKQPEGQSLDIRPIPEAAVIPKSRVTLDPQREYTLPELIDIAERENQQTRVAWEIAKNAALATGIAESTYLPRVSANIIGGFQGATGNDSALGVTVNSTGTVSGSVSAVSFEWLLFDFGGRTNTVSSAKRLATASNITFKGVHQKVIHDVCIAYYAYLAARLHVDTAQASLANARDIQNAAEARYASGVGTILESNQTRQMTAQAELGTIQAGGAERTAYASLLVATGLSPLENIKIAPLEERPISPESLQPIETIVHESLSRRADVLAAYTAEQASQSAVKAAEALNRPKLFVAGTGAYVSGQLGLTAIPSVGGQLPTLNISGSHWNSTVLVGLNFTIFDGRARKDAILQAQNNSAQAAANLDHIRIDAVREIVAAQDALTTSVSAHQAAIVLQNAAQINYDAAVDSYKNDVGTITAAVAAQTQLLQAKLAVDDAYSSTLSSAATLAFATGALTAAPH